VTESVNVMRSLAITKDSAPVNQPMLGIVEGPQSMEIAVSTSNDCTLLTKLPLPINGPRC
jgi:hypothetical protein